MAISNQENINFNDIETDISLIGYGPNKLYTPKASIVYLPGFGCDFQNHEAFKDLLTSYDYYALNFPAHGASKWKSTNELTISHFANLVVQFIEKRDLTSVVLIGHSSSAAVAALANTLIPERIIANILISPIENSFQLDADEIVDIIIPRLPSQFEQLQRLKVFNYDMKSENSPAWKKYANAKLAYFNENAEALSIILGYLLSPELKQSIENLYTTISAPTLLVYGDSDGLIRLNEAANKMQTLIPHASAILIPTAGHEPALDNPSNYFTNIISFIDAVVEARYALSIK